MEKPKGMEKINPKPQRDYQLFPKQFLNKHMTAVEKPMVCLGIMCLLSRGKWKMQTWRCLITWLTQPGPYQWGHTVWILLPLVNRAFCTTLFLEQTLDFPLAQHIGKELDVWGGGFLLLKRKRKNCVAYFRKRLLIEVSWCVRIFQLQINQTSLFTDSFLVFLSSENVSSS